MRTENTFVCSIPAGRSGWEDPVYFTSTRLILFSPLRYGSSPAPRKVRGNLCYTILSQSVIF